MSRAAAGGLPFRRISFNISILQFQHLSIPTLLLKSSFTVTHNNIPLSSPLWGPLFPTFFATVHTRALVEQAVRIWGKVAGEESVVRQGNGSSAGNHAVAVPLEPNPESEELRGVSWGIVVRAEVVVFQRDHGTLANTITNTLAVAVDALVQKRLRAETARSQEGRANPRASHGR
jgi:hypothetical protein